MATVLKNAPADPATLFGEEIADLTNEAKNWLDGEPIANEEQATAVSSLLSRLRRVSNDADDARKLEKKPHDEAAKEVQLRWVPILKQADTAASVAKEALAPWLRSVEERQRAEAQALRDEADRLASEAREQLAKADGNLDARNMAETLLAASQEATKDAKRADKAKAHATGGERAVGLVDVFTPELVDAALALGFYRAQQPDELKAWLVDQATKDVRSGVRAIPGFQIHHERKAR